jgi:hypothetical protein
MIRSIAQLAPPDGVVISTPRHRAEWLAWREKDVTASNIAALFGEGLHPYVTPYGLWALKSGRVGEDADETPAMRRGKLFEPVVVDILRQDNPGLDLLPSTAYFREPASRIGATPDCIAWRAGEDGYGAVQIKTAGYWSFIKDWRSPDRTIEPPLWIVIQASLEAYLTGASWAAVAVMNLEDASVSLIDIPLRPRLMPKLRELAAEFWRRVATNEPYPPDFKRDAAMIAKVFAEDDGGEVDLTGDARIGEILATRAKLKEVEAMGSAAEKDRKALDAEIIAKLGNAAHGIVGDGRVITALTMRRGGYSVASTTYRQVKVKEDRSHGTANRNRTQSANAGSDFSKPF